MKETSDIEILLRKHAKGELNDEERSTLEALLLERPELTEEMEFTKALVRVVEKAERQRLLSVIKSVEVQPDSPGLFQSLKRRVREVWEGLTEALFPPRRYQKLAWATVVVLLCAAVGLWWVNWRTDALGKFQQSAYISADVPGAFRRGTDGKPFSQAAKAYESGNYGQSLALLQDVPNTDSLYLFSLYLQGHNHYKLGNYEQAIAAFEAIVAQQSVPTIYKIPNPDNVGWTRILVLLSQYNENKTDSQKKVLKHNLEKFLVAADPADTPYPKAAELKTLLDKE